MIEDVARRSSAMLVRRMIRWLTVLAFGLFVAVPAAGADDAALWDALKSGQHVALLRHALAPGTGDPAAFTIDDCSTQRNLSEEGRGQAARIGERFRANGIEAARVRASQWCRCRETAELLKLGPVHDLPALNSFYQRPENREPQTQALQAWLRRQDLSAPHILVTHQVNITALTGVYPGSGELVIIRAANDGEVAVVGTIETD